MPPPCVLGGDGSGTVTLSAARRRVPTTGASIDARLVRAHAFEQDTLAVALLLLAQLALTALVVPQGNFGLADDWVYARSVEWLHAGQGLRLLSWSTATPLPQILLGAAVSMLAGVSFEVLRHLTQVVALGCVVAAYAWFRVAGLGVRNAAVASLTVMAVPLWPVLGNTFMTDLYALLPALVAATLLLWVLDQPPGRASWRWLTLASLVAAIGVLEREVVLVVPFAFLVASLWRGRGRWRTRLLVGALPLLGCVAALLAWHAFLAAGAGIPATEVDVHRRLWRFVAGAIAGHADDWLRIGRNLRDITGYLGLFSVGFLLFTGMPGASRRQRWAVAGLAVALAVVALGANWLPPYRDMFMLDRAGIGPFTLYDAQPRGLASLDRSAGVFWRVAGIGAAIGIAGLAVLALTTLRHVVRRGRWASPPRVFIAALVVAYVAPFVVTDFFDRYLVFVLPFVLALWAQGFGTRAPATSGADPPAEASPATVGADPAAVASSSRARVPQSASVRAYVPRFRQTLALGWLVTAALLGAIATHDYFAWNRARWQAIDAAEALGANADTLDGGYEYNGYLRLAQGMVPRTPGKSWWWVKDDRYVVAFSRLPGYAEIEAFPVDRWLPRTPATVRLLRRQP